MEFIKISNYLAHLNTLIKQECTGTASEFAIKLGVSERTLRGHLQQLRELNADIIYDRYKKTYKYASNGNIKFGYQSEQERQN